MKGKPGLTQAEMPPRSLLVFSGTRRSGKGPLPWGNEAKEFTSIGFQAPEVQRDNGLLFDLE